MRAKKSVSMKAVVLLLAVVLLIGGAVGGTLAWLAAQTNEVINTFTAGNITITLTENFNTKSDDATENDKWVGKIVPGGTEEKNPKITVQEGSEQCYVYALVENNMKIGDDVVVTPNISDTDWNVVATDGNKKLYRYKEAVDAASAAVECQVFTEVTYDGEKITEGNIAALADNTITVNAFAHQSENITAVTVADEAAKAHFGFPTTNP